LERIAVGFNPNISIKDSAEYASLAEGVGYGAFWVHENPFIGDAVSLLSSASMATKKIKLGSGCISVVTRHPLLAATTFVMLDQMSEGRAIMGVGLGGFPWLPKIGVKVFPVQETRPLRRIKEFLTITNSLLSGNSVTLDGEFYKVTDLKLESKIVRRPSVYLAAFGQKLLTMAPELADGVIISPALMTPEVTAQKVSFVKRGEDAGKPIDKASYILSTVSKDPEEAKKVMKSYYFLQYQVAEVIRPEIFQPYGITEKDLEPVKEAWRKRDLASAAKAMPDAVIDALTLTGDADECTERLKDYRKAGIDQPIIMPIGDMKTTIDAFAAH